MNNIELEKEIKEIIDNSNFFDMIIKAKEFEKDYKTSDFYKKTKMSLWDILPKASLFYRLNLDTFGIKLQKVINELDLTHLSELMDQAESIFKTEKEETYKQLQELEDFKNIINK